MILFKSAANSTLLKDPLLSLSNYLKTSLKTNSSVCFSVPDFNRLNLIEAMRVSKSFWVTERYAGSVTSQAYPTLPIYYSSSKIVIE